MTAGSGTGYITVHRSPLYRSKNPRRLPHKPPGIFPSCSVVLCRVQAVREAASLPRRDFPPREDAARAHYPSPSTVPSGRVNSAGAGAVRSALSAAMRYTVSPFCSRSATTRSPVSTLTQYRWA